jgi:hypothetical protein
MEYLRLSYSSGNTFESCARKFELDKLFPHRLKREEAYAADTGSALHAGYQHYLANRDKDAATWAFMEAFPYELEFQQDNDYRDFNACLATFDEMLDSFALGDYELAQIKRPDGLIVPATEVPFEIRFEGIELPPSPKYPNGCGVAFIGYIDAIMRNLMTDLYRTLDIKTHRDRTIDRTGKYKFDSQQVPYGIVVDHISGQPVESFEVLYLDTYIDIVDPRVKLYPFLKSREDLQEWLLTRVMQFQLMEKYGQGGFWPRTSGGCMFFNRPCRYLEPCITRDSKTLENWFLMGERAESEKPFEPWVTVTVNPFGG